jgi:acetoacetate decarboxylase
MNTTNKNVEIPKEILSYIPPGPFVFPLARYYVTSFKTDLSAIENMLPEMVLPLPGAEDNVLLQVNDFATYWEAVLSIPAVFVSDGKKIEGIYLSQLYLGSIAPEGSALPMMLGQVHAGYPKRDAIFTTQGFGEKSANVKFERWGTTIADMKHEMGEALTDWSALPFGSDLSNLTAFLLKAIPTADGSGWDALQLTTPMGDDGEIVRVNQVETTFTGDVVLDSGRVLPINEIQYSLYYEIKNMGLTHADILNDYLKA